jgi:hypothetical protein
MNLPDKSSGVHEQFYKSLEINEFWLRLHGSGRNWCHLRRNLPKFQLYSRFRKGLRFCFEGGAMVQRDRAVGPEVNGDRRGLQRHLMSTPSAQISSRRNPEIGSSSRLRQSQPARISFEDPKAAKPIRVGTSGAVRGILLGGILLAVVGVVHASWSSAEQREVAPSISEDVLNRQIAQLRAELDKERAEKSELIEKVAAAEAQAMEARAVELPPAEIQSAESRSGESQAVEPPPAAIQTVMQSNPAPEPEQISEENDSLPAPMAPSVELMLSDTPVAAIPVASETPAPSSGTYGIHLASFADRIMAERGWQLLQRNHVAALGQLKPRINEAADDKGNTVYLLIAGPFETEELAASHCKKINTQVVFCKPRDFSGSDVAGAAE